MKILMLVRLYWPHVGGVEVHVEGLAKELVARGHAVTILTEQFEPSLPLREKKDGITIVRIPHSALSSKLKVWQFVRKKTFLFTRNDIIHIHDVFWWYYPIRLSLKDKSVFTTFHGYEGSEPPRWQAVVQRKMIEKLSKRTIIIGDFMRKWYRTKPDLVLYGAAAIKPSVKKTGVPSAIFAGRLDEDTGIMTYLKAIQLMKETLFLDIYGDGPQRKQVEAFIKKHSLPAALHGWTTKIHKAYKKADIAFVSRYLAILEAMQAKLLVVAVFNNEIKKDYLDCHPRRASMIAAATGKEVASLLSQLKPEEKREMIETAYGWAKRQTFVQLADHYESLWQIR